MGTCLTGAAAALLLGAAPAAAQQAPATYSLRAPTHAVRSRAHVPLVAEIPPQDLTLLPVAGGLDTPPSAPTTGIFVAGAATPSFAAATFAAPAGTPAGAAIFDPTVALIPGAPSDDVVINEGTVATDTDYASGIATRTNGTTSITVDSVSTDGRRSAGIHAYGYGDITIDAGSVETHGYRSDGIYANNNVGGHGGGGISITAGSVETAGYASTGIRASAYQGSTSITADSVKTSGYGSDGIYGWSYYGDTTVNVGSVETSGTGGRGITAYSGGTTTVIVGDVTTTGDGVFSDLNAGGILAVGAAVNVQAGNVSTKGDYSAGIYANSNFVHDNGQYERDITVTADSVTTEGFASHGVVAVNTAAGSQTSVDVGSVKTGGDSAIGIYAFAPLGDVSVHAGTVETGGMNAPGVIAASYYGNVAVDVGSVTTTGDYSPGIYTYAGGKQFSGGTTNTVKVDDVTTSGTYSTGIQTISLGQRLDTSIDAGSVTTHGYGASGIRAIADGMGNAITINAGSVSTDGTFADGIDAINYAVGGKIDITAGSVATHGYGSAGIFTYALDSDTHVSVDHVATEGDLSFGISLGARYGDVTLDAGTIETQGNSSFGISASGENVTVNADSVSTKGESSVGINAGAMDSVIVNAGSVTTLDGLARGIDASGTQVTVVAGDVTTSGTGSTAIYAIGYGPTASVDLTVNGAVSVGGAYSQGVQAFSGGTLAVHNNGSITTEGTGGRGINAYAVGDILVDGAGSIETHGLAAQGVYAISYGGSIDITQGSISTTGDRAAGVYAITLPGPVDNGPNHINIDVDSVSTTGDQSIGIRAFGGTPDTDIDIKTNGVTTAGNYSIGIYAGTYSGNVTIDASNVSTQGDFASGVIGRSVYGDVSVTADNVSTSGYFSNAVEAVSAGYYSDGHVSVTASNLSAGSYSSAVYARGGSVDISLSGTIEKSGTYAAVGAFATSGDIVIHNDATITTKDAGPYGAVLAQGIFARAAGDVTIDGSGSISTEGQLGYGIAAYSTRGGAITISQSDITTNGYTSHGVVAVTSNGVGYAASDGPGGITVALDNITINGNYSSAMLLSDNTKHGNVLATVSGAVKTYGDFGEGVSLYSANGTATAELNSVETHGYYSQTVHLNAHKDVLHFIGDLSTEGVLSTAVVAYAGNGGIEISGSGDITTTGSYFSSGIRASSPGDIDIAVSGAISTEGRGSNGIEVTERKRHSEVYPYDPPADDAEAAARALADGFPTQNPRDPETAATGSTITIAAQSIHTSGMNSDGIMASTSTGNVDITTGTVAVTGKGSIGIFAEGRNLTADVGNTSSTQATAIALQSYDSAQLNVRGAVSGGTDGVLLQGYQTGIAVAQGGSITGAVNGVVIDATPHVTPIVHYWGYAPESYIGDDEPQPVPPANPAPGGTVINNAGTISAGTGYAVTVTGGAATLNNSGVIETAVQFDRFDDTVNNAGVFIATRDSDFGAGNDLFVNSGVFKVAAPTAAAGTARAAAAAGTSVTLSGLETFRNMGTVDLRNGVAGDTLTLPGNFIGSGASTVAVDVGPSGADKFVVQGAATGSTAVVIAADPKAATLLANPVDIIQTGAGSSADAFTLANADVGLIRYGMAFDAATGTFSVTSAAGAPVYRLAKLNEGAQAVWQQSATAWSTHMAQLRDIGATGSGLWGQMYGSVVNRDGTNAGSNVDYRQDFYGGQLGYDLGGAQDAAHSFAFGVTGGYLSSHQNFKASAERVTFDTVNLGGYGSFRAGPLFANLLAQYDHYWVKAQNSSMAAHWKDSVGGDAYGVEGQIGARLGSGRLFAEPAVSLAWQHSDIGSIMAYGQSIDFDGSNALTGKAGARVGGSVGLGGSTTGVFYVRGNYVHEFDGKSGLLFTSGGVSQAIANVRPGDYGEGAVGLTIGSAGPVSGFLEGDAIFGSSAKGGGGRVGIRFQF